MDHLGNCHGELSLLVGLLSLIPFVGRMLAGWIATIVHRHRDHDGERGHRTLMLASMLRHALPQSDDTAPAYAYVVGKSGIRPEKRRNGYAERFT